MFEAPIFTNAGRRLLNRAIAGENLTFTSIRMGKGSLGSSDIASMTDLIEPAITLGIHKVKAEDETATITASFSNKDFNQGFLFKELGLFAKDPDGGADILYCYQNAYDTAEYIAASASELIEKQISIISIVGSAEHVSATIDGSLVYVTWQEFEEYLDNRPKFFIQEEEPDVNDCIWIKPKDSSVDGDDTDLLNQARVNAVNVIAEYAADKEPVDTMSHLVAVYTVQIYAASDSNEIDDIVTAAKAAIDEAFRYKITTYLDGVTETTAYYVPGEKVSVTAAVVEGSTFSYWVDAEGNLVSVSKTYTFKAANRTLKAIYDEPITQESSVTFLGASAEESSDGRHYVIFPFRRLITSGTVVKYGVLYGTNRTEIEGSLELDENGDVQKFGSVRSQEIVSDSKTGTATVKVSVGTGSNDDNLVYACGYAVVQTTDGEYELIKSEIVSASYNSASGSDNDSDNDNEIVLILSDDLDSSNYYAEIDGELKSIENMVDSDSELTDGNYRLKIT